jgi:hypothetical protein
VEGGQRLYLKSVRTNEAKPGWEVVGHWVHHATHGFAMNAVWKMAGDEDQDVK